MNQVGSWCESFHRKKLLARVPPALEKGSRCGGCWIKMPKTQNVASLMTLFYHYSLSGSIYSSCTGSSSERMLYADSIAQVCLWLKRNRIDRITLELCNILYDA